MASVKLSLTFILLLSGLVVFGEIGRTGASCDDVVCLLSAYIICDNYPNQKLHGCACWCAPKDGKNCVLYGEHGWMTKCKPQE